MNNFLQDIRFGLRTLRKSPGFTFVAIITLAFGMAANTTIFTIVNAILLRPLPVAHAEQIVVLSTEQKNNPLNMAVSYLDFLDFQKQAHGFDDLFAYEFSLVGLAADAHASHFVVSYVSPNFFSALGIQPALGRFILPTEGQSSGADPVLVLGYTYWRTQFGGDASVVGKQVLVNGHPMMIVGVAPKGFYGVYSIADCQGYIPASMAGVIDPDSKGMWTDRSDREFQVLGRLKKDVSPKQAEAALNVTANQLGRQYPDTDKGITVHVYPERLARPEPDANNPVPAAAVIFLALAGLVLLLACFNIANVLLVRATVRQREMAIRAALGAKRARLVRQCLTESLLLAFFGGVAGAVLATWASGALSSISLATDLPLRLDFSPDGRVLLYALGAVLITGIVVGIAPAIRVARTDLSAVLHEGGRGSSDGPRRKYLRNVLVVAQVAGSLVLLVMAGLSARSLNKAEHLNLGFAPDHLLNMTMDVGEVGYNEAQGRAFYRQAEDRLRALPGVSFVAEAHSIPMGYYSGGDVVYVEGHPVEAGQQPPELLRNLVTPNYFQTMRMPIARGRAFTDSDGEKAPLVAIVNQSMAKKFWPDQDAIGKRISTKSQTGPYIEIVGVVQDAKYRGPNEEPRPFFYLPIDQSYDSFRVIQIRTRIPPEQLAVVAQTTLHEMAPNLPVFDVQTMEEALNGGNGFFLYRFGAEITTGIGFLGLVLAIVGVYSVVSYAAAQRSHEIGIRMALGANPREILKMILRQGLGVVGIGLAIGLAAAFAGTRAASQMFVGVRPSDPTTYVAVVAILAGVALLACWIPARRATRVDPLVALRHE
ncbi:MAG: ABC transporter permease [Candidatus Acidiferrales bacterium]|jgi:predicted permease